MNAKDIFRDRTARNVQERIYTTEVLLDEGKKIYDAQTNAINHFAFIKNGDLLKRRNYKVSRGALTMTFPIQMRFIDMKRVKNKRQKSAKVYNTIVMGHFNNIARRLKYGFSEAIRAKYTGDFIDEFSKAYEIEI